MKRLQEHWELLVLYILLPLPLARVIIGTHYGRASLNAYTECYKQTVTNNNLDCSDKGMFMGGFFQTDRKEYVVNK